jgi:hypothetical protein
MQKKEWIGSAPKACDLCKKVIDNEFIDGVISSVMCWAIMCRKCHAEEGSGIGQGRGQVYQKEGNRFVKVAG